MSLNGNINGCTQNTSKKTLSVIQPVDCLAIHCAFVWKLITKTHLKNVAKHSTSLFKISLTDSATDDGDPIKEETDMNPSKLSQTAEDDQGEDVKVSFQPQVSSSPPASAPTAGTIELP